MQRWQNVSPEEWHALGRKLADEQARTQDRAWWGPLAAVLTNMALWGALVGLGFIVLGLWGGGFL